MQTEVRTLPFIIGGALVLRSCVSRSVSRNPYYSI